MNTSSPSYYVFPSVAVNSTGDALVGFSCARATEYIGAVWWGRRANGVTSSSPVLLQAAIDYHNGTRWGDYPATVTDTDGTSFWTIQEYAEKQEPLDPLHAFGLWVSKVRLNP